MFSKKPIKINSNLSAKQRWWFDVVSNKKKWGEMNKKIETHSNDVENE